jgi:hypothetical protein
MKKFTFCVPMDEELQHVLLDGLRDYPMSQDDEIEFVHVFKQVNYI